MITIKKIFAALLIGCGAGGWFPECGAVTRTNGRPSRAMQTASVARSVSPIHQRVKSRAGVQNKAVRSRSGALPAIMAQNDMLNTCKAQYTQCMDNFCNVLDDNQGRCSCSANLKNYATTEAALKKATEDLQDVAQKIQYIGLSGDEIETLFTQTEAELKMQNTTDNTQLKNDLDRIKNLIVDVKSGNATTTDTGLSLDLSGLLDFTISSTGFDLASMFGNTANTSSISNQRGEQLYKTATSRCKAAVLNTCSAQGVDISLITNAYDLEIDKQCIQYERSLTETNTQMASTVRNAKSVLQKARLMVAQQKNQYDLRGCINALDSCMQDEFVCGSDYENCLDPTGKWIVNGEVVTGSKIGDAQITDADIETMLRGKIGIIDTRGRAKGFCASVMQKCQNYTMKNGKYDENNSLITEYITRTGKIIKNNRSSLINEYAQRCIGDVVSCLNKNSNVSGGMFSNAAINSCRGVITACKSATGSGDVSSVKQWLQQVLGNADSGNSNSSNDDTTSGLVQYMPTPSSLPSAATPSSEHYAEMQRIDNDRCLAIPGGHISASGTMCVIWGGTDAYFDLATSYGWAQLQNWDAAQASWMSGKQAEDYDTGETYPATLYIMKWAYEEAFASCNLWGGVLSVVPGKHQNQAFAWCTVEFPAGEITDSQCASLAMLWPTPFGDQKKGGEISTVLEKNGVPIKQNCKFMHPGLWYVGRDLPGICLPGMEEMQELGSCTCKPGLYYDGVFRCNESGKTYVH